MDLKRISMDDIVVGECLPWDVYDARNQLLLRRGHLIERTQQIESLVERGLFVDTKQLGSKEAQVAPVQELPSVLRLMNTANKQLEKLLFSLHTETQAEPKFVEIAKAVAFAVDVNTDVALACILLNQAGSSYATRHAIDTAVVCLLVARSLKKPPGEVQSVVCAALTMNAGMLRYQEQFQNKAEELSSEEKQLIRAHPEESTRILKQAGVTDETWLSCVLLHHENEDGTGYPVGCKGPEISENAKILAIADRYCARVSSRSYRKALLPNAAMRDLLVADKKKIDPQLAAAFIHELGVFPTGTYVRLENGEIGVVTHRGKTTTTPVVHALVGPRGAPLSFPIKRETAKKLYAIRDVLDENQASVRVTMQQLWGTEAAI